MRSMRMLRLLAALIVVSMLPLSRSNAQTPTTNSPINRLLSQGANVARHSQTGYVRWIGAATGTTLDQPVGLNRADTLNVANAYLAEYGNLFGLAQASDATVAKTSTTQDGRQVVRYQQRYQGVPVIAGELQVQVNQAGELLSINGEVLPNLNLSTNAKISQASAINTAQSLVATKYDVNVAALNVSNSELAIYNPALLGGTGLQKSNLVWFVTIESTSSDPIREYVFVNAQSGDVSLSFNQIGFAKNRFVCNDNNVVDNDDNPNNNCDQPGEYVRTEGSAASNDADIDAAYDYSGDTYDFYNLFFGRNSIDNNGMNLISLVKHCPPGAGCPYGNAFWNGRQMTYGEGFAAADDVVAHELSHGVTEYTSNLFYYFQSGAINEAMSDIFGEFMDQTNGSADDDETTRWIMGEDLGGIRNMQDPTQGDQPDRMLSELYVLDPNLLDSGGVHSNSGVANKAAYLLTDGDTFNGQTIASIGITKTAHLFYETQISSLTSGSDYADLASALRQACTSLTGSHGITAADCAEVQKTILATEMDLQPTNAPAPDMAACSPGQTMVSTFHDGFESLPNNRWTASALSGNTQTWTTDPGPIVGSYAASGGGSATNYNGVYGWNQEVEASAFTQNASVTVPTNGFAYFRHAYDFYAPIDAGVVEYSTNNGSSWQSAAGLFSFNGPTNIAEDGAFGGEQAFVGNSHGYTASRLNLASLAGQSIRFRFKVALGDTPTPNRSVTWSIDDFEIYTCNGPAAPAAPSLFLSSDVLVQQGKQTSTTIGTASDDLDLAGALTVSTAGAPTGLNVSISNQAGILKANVNCACSTAVGTYPITVTVRDSGNLMASQVLNVEIEPAGQSIINGGFELGTNWQAFSNSFSDVSPPLCSLPGCAGAPRTGTSWLRFGARAGTTETAFAQQTFTTTAGDATLEFYLSIYAHNGRGIQDYVKLSLDGEEIFRVSDANTEYDNGYAKVTIPLTDLSAGEHVLRFDSVSNSTANIVRFSIDDISFVTETNQCRGSNLYLPMITK